MTTTNRPTGSPTTGTTVTRTTGTRTTGTRTTGTRTTARSEVLDRLLDAELDRSPLARGGYISHLAMGLVAAERLGASDDQLDSLFSRWTSGSFLVGRERPAELAPLTVEVERRGIDAVVAERLPAMVEHPGAQFLHAVIRLDLAIDSRHPGQVANALLNWSADSVPPVPDIAGSGDSSFADVMARVTDGDVDALDHLDAGDDLLDQISDWAAVAHEDPGDFGTLHYVTGSRAVRSVVGYLDEGDRRTIERRLAQALVGFTDRFGPVRIVGEDEVDDRRGIPLPGWQDLSATAIASGDPHTIKLTYACRLDEERDGDPLHRWVAARQTAIV